MSKLLFWKSLGLIIYTYIGFPLLTLVQGFLRRKPIKKADITPSVSLIIAAYNEQDSIAERIENALAMDYPSDKLEIIVASDGSTDRTNAIGSSYSDPRLRFLALPRQGKIGVLNTAVPTSTGEILVFSDATSMFAPDALRLLVRSFADSTIGGVGGCQYYGTGESAASAGERSYWSFDRFLRDLQSHSGSMTSAGGAMYAIRRSLYTAVPVGASDDFLISARVVAQGYRLVFEPAAVVYETIATDDTAEFQRKVRVITQGLRSVWLLRELLNPFHHGWYALQLFTHKVLRRSVVWPLIVLFGATVNLYRSGERFYRLALYGQGLVYLSALLAFLLRSTALVNHKAWKILALPYYFCLVNLASLRAWLRVLKKQHITMWR